MISSLASLVSSHVDTLCRGCGHGGNKGIKATCRLSGAELSPAHYVVLGLLPMAASPCSSGYIAVVLSVALQVLEAFLKFSKSLLVADIVRIHKRAVLVDLHAGQAFEAGKFGKQTARVVLDFQTLGDLSHTIGEPLKRRLDAHAGAAPWRVVLDNYEWSRRDGGIQLGYRLNRRDGRGFGDRRQLGHASGLGHQLFDRLCRGPSRQWATRVAPKRVMWVLLLVLLLRVHIDGMEGRLHEELFK